MSPSIERDDQLAEVIAKVEQLTKGELKRFLSIVHFGWQRIQAGEDIEAIVADWRATVC